MLEQYRQTGNNSDFSSDANDVLSESRFQMSRRKLVLTLAGAALALVFFLFLIGAFRESPTQTISSESNSSVEVKLQDLQARVEKIEQQFPQTVNAKAPALAELAVQPQDLPNQENTIGGLSDQALKELIASEALQQELQPDSEVVASTPTPLVTTEPATALPAAPAGRSYVVQRGDTLSKISQKFYGTTKRWQDIYNANRDRIASTNQLKVGTKLVIPEDASK